MTKTKSHRRARPLGLKSYRFILTLTLLFCGLAFGGTRFLTGAAQNLAVTRAARQTPDTAEVDRLIAAAREKGAARIIVRLPLATAPEADQSPAAEDARRVVIGAAQSELLGALAAFEITNVKQFKYIPFLAFEADAAALEFLKTSPAVSSVTEDRLGTTALTESTALIGAPAAWNAGFSGAGQAIAVLDTGVDKTHPIFAGKIVSEACYSTNADNAASFCPGGASSSTAPGAGLNCTGANLCEHGTYTAGIAAGFDAATDTRGVAKDAKIIAIQVFSRFNDAQVCEGNAPCARFVTSDLIRGLERVYELRGDFSIAAANLSLGGGRFYDSCDTEEAATKAIVDLLRAAKIATVTASGNDGWSDSMDAPACISTTISVGSTRDAALASGDVDTVSVFSNGASFLSLLAPGETITSSVPGGGYLASQGTSAAAPHVAGAFAVLKNRNPRASVAQIFDALDRTGAAITDTRNNVTKKRVKINAAVHALPEADRIVFTHTDNLGTDIWTMKADGSDRRRVTSDSTEEETPSFSPDGTKILYEAGGGIYVMNADGSNAVRVRDSFFANRPSFSPDGTKIVFDENSEVKIMNADGSNARVFPGISSAGIFPSITPSFSPDGSKITFSGVQPPVFQYSVFTISLDGSGLTRLTPGGLTYLAPSFSPDGNFVAAYNSSGEQFGGIYRVNADGSTLAPVRLTTNPRDRFPVYSPDGGKLAFERLEADFVTASIHTANPDGTNQTPIGIANDKTPRWYTPAATLPSFSISGQVIDAGGGLANATLTLTGGATPLTAATDAGGRFTIANVPGGGNYTLTPSANGFVFTPSDRTITDLSGDLTDMNFAGAPDCSYQLNPVRTEGSLPAAGGTGSFTLTTQNGCAWTTQPADWISVSPASGTGGATINFAAAANGSNSPRSGVILVGGQSFTVYQAGAPQTFSISGRLTGAAGGMANVTVQLTGGATLVAATDAEGNYAFQNLPAAGNYTVTPAPVGSLSFTPAFRVFNNLAQNVGGANFTTAATRTLFDYTGDGKADLTAFRPTNGAWWSFDQHAPDDAQRKFLGNWGMEGDAPISADYDGDGVMDLAVARANPQIDYYEIWISQSSNQTVRPVEYFGKPSLNDIPVLNMDYDGDGKADLAVARFGTTPFGKIRWWIKQSSDNQAAVLTFGDNFDLSGPLSVPLTGDVDGDRRSDLIVWRHREGSWWVRRSSDGAEYYLFHWGLSGDMTALADYDGDGKTDIAVYRPETKTFWINQSSNSIVRVTDFSSLVPTGSTRAVPADYDGDGKADPAVFHDASATWYIVRSSDGVLAAQEWGYATDLMPAQGISPSSFLTRPIEPIR